MSTQTAASPVTRNEMRPVKYHYADTFWCTYVISVVSANIAELGRFPIETPTICSENSSSFYFFDNVATYPLDLTKTRLQIQGEANKLNGNKLNAVKTVNFSF